MKYTHILNYVASVPWAILPDKMQEILSVLAFRAAGHSFTSEEIQARIGEAKSGARASSGGGVAVIPIRGVIAHRMGGMDDMSGGTSAERISAMLKQVSADESISTIVYDIDSPGGTVPGVQELASQMFALRGVKTQIAQVNDLAASAAYWLASQADEIVSLPSGSAGSIGVFTVHQDLSKALEAEGIKIDVIKAGKYKTEGNPFEPLSEESRAFIQARVDEAYSQFVKDVARGRGVNASDVKGGYGEGRVLTAKDAKAAGLIDRIATFDETLSRVTGRSSSAMRAETNPREDAGSLRRLERFDTWR
jgi:signal peptide peptidase SppA